MKSFMGFNKKFVPYLLLIILFSLGFAESMKNYKRIPTTIEEMYGPGTVIKINDNGPVSDNIVGGWQQRANIIPSARYYAASVGFERNDTGWLYVFGGDTTGGGIPTRTCSKYNVRTNSWSLIAPLPVPMRVNAAARLGNKLYSMGGFTSAGNVPPVSLVYEYDVNTNIWTQKANMPIPIFFHKAVGMDDSVIYVAGGMTTSIDNSDVILNKCFRYDRLMNTWTEDTPLPIGLADGGFSGGLGKLAYLSGFRDAAGNLSSRVFLAHQTYNDGTGSLVWEEGHIKQDSGDARFTMVLFDKLRQRYILAGGSPIQFQPRNTSWLFDWYVDTVKRMAPRPAPVAAYSGGETIEGMFGSLPIRVFVTAGGITMGPVMSNQTFVYIDTITSIGIRPVSTELPESYKLFQNYPNPFNPETKIRFAVPPNGKIAEQNVRLVIFDITGREAETLINEKLTPGTYETVWDASNYPSGFYFYKLISGSFTGSKKMVLVK
jgi:hypothetical protein